MVNVAVAGGSGGVGRAIIDGLKEQKKHDIVILSRKENPELAAEIGVKIVAIDYTDVASIQKTLEDLKINTIISALSIQSKEHGDAQLNLIRAAAAAPSVKRFTPSEFGILYEKKHAAIFPIAQFKLDAIDELKKTDLEYTLFSNGFFLDYLGQPKVQSYLSPLVIVIDFQHKVAGIPGKGTEPIAFTRTKDVGRFVAASIGLDKWPERSIIIGDKKSWNEILAIAEKVTGSKFKTTYDPVEKLQTFQVTELPSHVPVYPFFPKEALQGMLAIFGGWFAAGDFDLDVSQGKFLNKEFPEIKPTTVEQIITEGWGS